ncbi:MAG: ATP-binding protein [Sphingomonas sp.]
MPPVIVLSQTAAVASALVVSLWLAVAMIATIAGMRRWRAAQAVAAEARDLASLLDGGPALLLRIRRDGRVKADDRLANWLGLPDMPDRLEDLTDAAGGGLVAQDRTALAEHVAAAQRSGGAFSLAVRVAQSDRVLMARGVAGESLGEVVLWMFDATDSEREIARLVEDAAGLARTLEGLSALIEAAPFPMWHRGPDLRLALVNSAYVAAVEGESAADVVARGLELVEGKGGKGPLAAAAAVRESGHVSTRSAPATISGMRRTLRIVDVPIGDAGVAGYAIDVEELEVARADLGRFARAQREMLDLLSAGVAQFGPDRALVFSNQPFARIFALRPEWLADRPEFDRVLERMREGGRLPESRDFPAWKAEHRRWFNAVDESIEENWLLPGGNHLRVLAQPLPDGGLLLVFEDRTEQVQLASARDTLLRVRTATFDNLFEAVGVFAADGRLQLWNNRFRDAWGMSEQELALHPRVDALVDAAAKRLANPSRAGLVRELVRIATTERQQRSGRVGFIDGRDFEFIAVPLPDGNALFTMLDITDSRRIERALRDRNEALEESDRLKNAFVANMSYELRTPLTSIGGFAEMLANDYAGPLGDTARDYVAAILESVQQLGTMIDDVLDLSQVEAGNLAIARQPVDLAMLARAAAADFADSARARGITLVVTVDPSVGMISGDHKRLRQAVDHLLKNAIAYIPAGGRVLVHADGDPAMARIVVSDDGPGISIDDREKIFARFERIAPRPRDGGAGIGLPLTRQFVEAHGGTLTLLSEPGEGTALIIRLPRA